MAGQESTHYAEAERLYVREEMTLAQVADALGQGGPGVSTLSRWSRKGDWPGQRERWRAVNQDLPSRLLNTAQRRLSHLEGHPDEARGDELFKLKSLFEFLRMEMSGPEESGRVDRLAVWLELMGELVEDLKELEPAGVNLRARHYEELVRRARRRYA